MDHMHHMHHDESGHLPEGIKKSSRAKYPIGTTVKLLTDHMADMQNAKAVVVGVFDTIVYAVSYNDTETGQRIEDHKWVVDEEISHDREALIGDKVQILATHMSGMSGAIGEVDRVIYEPVYMVDYESTEDGHWIKNHQWVVESEVEAWED